jgi:hypothetical protein
MKKNFHFESFSKKKKKFQNHDFRDFLISELYILVFQQAFWPSFPRAVMIKK